MIQKLRKHDRNLNEKKRKLSQGKQMNSKIIQDCDKHCDDYKDISLYIIHMNSLISIFHIYVELYSYSSLLIFDSVAEIWFMLQVIILYVNTIDCSIPWEIEKNQNCVWDSKIQNNSDCCRIIYASNYYSGIFSGSENCNNALARPADTVQYYIVANCSIDCQYCRLETDCEGESLQFIFAEKIMCQPILNGLRMKVTLSTGRSKITFNIIRKGFLKGTWYHANYLITVLVCD